MLTMGETNGDALSGRTDLGGGLSRPRERAEVQRTKADDDDC